MRQNLIVAFNTGFLGFILHQTHH